MISEFLKEDKIWVDKLWERLIKKLSWVADVTGDKIPYTVNGGVHDDMAAVSNACWTNGFWPGLMIMMYNITNDGKYLDIARRNMDRMDSALESYDKLNHDVGFMWNISSGADYRLTGNAKQRNRFLLAANHLMGRYNPNGRFIRAWDTYRGREVKGWAIIDSMMNIPILYRASEETGDERYKMAAMNHADKTMEFQVRKDGSCAHVVEYDEITGEFCTTHTGQGYSGNPASAWSRGQAWGIYGFALSYAYTGKQEYLDTAKQIAHYFIANVALNNWIPLCDFRAPSTPVIYDATAGAAAACGLIEIANFSDRHERSLYLDAAMRILRALTEQFCDFSDESESVLQMGTEGYDGDRRHHIPIVYGDFFLTEAFCKLRGYNNFIW